MKIRLHISLPWVSIIGVQRINKPHIGKFFKDIVGKSDLQVVITILEFDIEGVNRKRVHRQKQAQQSQ